MAEVATPHLWRGRVVLVVVVLVLLAARVLPIDTLPRGLPWPDLVLVVIMVWVARRPELAPAILVAALAFLTDIICQRPPGAWAAVVLLASEGLRSRHVEIRNMSLVAEWLFIGAAIVAVTLGYRLVLAVAMTPQAPLGLTLLQAVMSILACPPVMAAAHLLLGVSRPGRGERNLFGSHP